jgi:hypothetical protein
MPATQRRHRIEYEDLDGLIAKFVPENPKGHDFEFLEESFEEFDFVMPVLVDERSKMVGAGHGRLEQLRRWRDGGNDAPDGIEVRKGKWHVPVIRGVSFKSRKALMKYILADNRGVELGGWDNGALAKMLVGIGAEDLTGTGFGSDDYAAYVVTNEGGEGDENVYTKKIQSPIYEPKGEKPKVGELCDLRKTAKLLTEIEDAKVPEEVKTFLRLAAQRHAVFDYEKIAEFYAHASKAVQDLCENSALVIIDFKKAIEQGFVVMTKEIADGYPPDADAAE